MDRTPPNKCTKFVPKNVQELLSNHIFGVGSFFKPHPVDSIIKLMSRVIEKGESGDTGCSALFLGWTQAA